MMTVEEERKFLSKAKDGCLDSRNFLITANYRLVTKIASRYELRGCLTYEDLIQEGVLGLIRAIEKFNLVFQNRFSTYAVPWIKQKIQRALSSTAHIIYSPPRVKGCNIHFADVAPEMITDSRSVEGVDLEDREILGGLLRCLNKRQRMIVELCGLHTMAEVARQLGMTREGVRQNKERAIKKLKEYASNAKRSSSRMALLTACA